MGELGLEIITSSSTWQTIIGMKGKGLEGWYSSGLTPNKECDGSDLDGNEGIFWKNWALKWKEVGKMRKDLGEKKKRQKGFRIGKIVEMLAVCDLGWGPRVTLIVLILWRWDKISI